MEVKQLPMACPNCGCDLVKDEDNDGFFLVCWSNLWWKGNTMKGCGWLGTLEELFRDHGFVRQEEL